MKNEFDGKAKWLKMPNIKKGDLVEWWTQNAKVISNKKLPDGNYSLTVYDQVERKNATFTYKKNEELRVTRR